MELTPAFIDEHTLKCTLSTEECELVQVYQLEQKIWSSLFDSRMMS